MAEPFEKLFGDTSELRVIESLIPNRDYNFNISEIAEESDISRQAAIPVVRKFLDWGLIKFDCKHANANYYKVNEESEIIKAFRDINKSVIKALIGCDLQSSALQLSNSPCIQQTSPIEVTCRSYVAGIDLNGQETNLTLPHHRSNR